VLLARRRTFGAKRDIATGSNPVFVAIGDLNGDGRSDVVAVNSNSNSASVLLGDSNGTFGAKTDYGTGEPQFHCIGGSERGRETGTGGGEQLLQ